MSAQTRLFMCRSDNFGVLLHDPKTGKFESGRNHLRRHGVTRITDAIRNVLCDLIIHSGMLTGTSASDHKGDRDHYRFRRSVLSISSKCLLAVVL